MTEPEQLLTPEEVAGLLHLKISTVSLYLRTGRLPGLKIGDLWRVRVSDLNAYIEDAAVKAAAKRSAAARKANETRGPDGRSEAARKANRNR